jgi:hypothetical protein
MSNDPNSLKGVTVHPVRNTKVAAALLTVGVPFAFDTDPITNVYSDGKPYRRGMPGDITYMMAARISEENGAETHDLISAYSDNTFAPAHDFDALLAELRTANPELAARFDKAYPRALMAYGRAFHENRDRINAMWQKALPMILVRKSPTSWTLIHKDASQATRQRFGIR